MQTLACLQGCGCYLDPVMLTCVLQGAPTCVIPYAIHTDTPIDTVVLLTIICVHSTRRPFKAGRTGAPVVGGRGWKGAGKAFGLIPRG